MRTATATAATAAAITTTRTAKSITRYLPVAARILLGLVFFVFGLDYFLHFIPQPTTPPPAGAMNFFGALFQTGYMFPMIKGVEVLVGALLLSNRMVPLALALIAPIVVNIFAFAAFLAPTGVPIAGAIVAIEIYLAWSYRNAYRPMLALRTVPGSK